MAATHNAKAPDNLQALLDTKIPLFTLDQASIALNIPRRDIYEAVKLGCQIDALYPLERVASNDMRYINPSSKREWLKKSWGVPCRDGM